MTDPRKPREMLGTVLDQLENWKMTPEETDENHEALMALARLAEGLQWLYEQTVAAEVRAARRFKRDGVVMAILTDVDAPAPLGAVACWFQWYAVSACNYAQLVGWLRHGDSERAKDYVRLVMPRLLAYRHKVAAHLALTEPKKTDNEADLLASVESGVTYGGGRLWAGSLSRGVKVDGEEQFGNADLSWCLTRAHEMLMGPRYWPRGIPKHYPAIRLPPGTTTMKFDFDDGLPNPPFGARDASAPGQGAHG